MFFSVHFETLGCKLNQIETESLARAFADAGFDTADTLPVLLALVNTCTVTGKAEQKGRHLVRSLLRRFPLATVLVTGCQAELEAAALAAIDPRVAVLPGTRKGSLADLPAHLARSLIPASRTGKEKAADIQAAITCFPGIITGKDPCTGTPDVESAKPAGITSQTVNQPGFTPLSIDPFRLSTDSTRFHSRPAIKIQDGCNNRCAYCRIRLARGPARSLDSSEAIRRIQAIEQNGAAEVVLTGVNLSQYTSNGTDLAGLLEQLLEQTERIAFRISSLYPERVDQALLPILAHPRIRPHFHLSIQSGSDSILRAMRRPYNLQTVVQSVEGLRHIKNDPFIACDLITGFPGETDQDFEDTLSLCRVADFADIHAFPFSPRPGTEAWSMKPRVPERVAGERLVQLAELAALGTATYRKRWLGKTVSAVVEESRPGEPGRVLTENYLTLAIPGLNIERGKQVLVRICEDESGEFVSEP